MEPHLERLLDNIMRDAKHQSGVFRLGKLENKTCKSSSAAKNNNARLGGKNMNGRFDFRPVAT